MNEPRSGSGYLRQHQHKSSPGSPYHLYEQAKASWAASHPEATPSQYAAAMTRIAKELNI